MECFAVYMIPTQTCQGISSPTWELPKAPNQEVAKQTEGQRQDRQGSHANASKSLINSWVHWTAWLGEFLLGASVEEEEEMTSQESLEQSSACGFLHISTLVNILKQCWREHMIWWEPTLNSSWNQGRFWTNQQRAMSTALSLMKGFFFHILGAESSLIKSQLQMPVGALMKTA